VYFLIFNNILIVFLKEEIKKYLAEVCHVITNPDMKAKVSAHVGNPIRLTGIYFSLPV
jgi:hypothetical protein